VSPLLRVQMTPSVLPSEQLEKQPGIHPKPPHENP
jgi:hypothetical protein